MSLVFYLAVVRRQTQHPYEYIVPKQKVLGPYCGLPACNQSLREKKAVLLCCATEEVQPIILRINILIDAVAWKHLWWSNTPPPQTSAWAAI